MRAESSLIQIEIILSHQTQTTAFPERTLKIAILAKTPLLICLKILLLPHSTKSVYFYTSIYWCRMHYIALVSFFLTLFGKSVFSKIFWAVSFIFLDVFRAEFLATLIHLLLLLNLQRKISTIYQHCFIKPIYSPEINFCT